MNALIEHNGQTYRVIWSLREYQGISARVAKKKPRSDASGKSPVQTSQALQVLFPSRHVGFSTQGDGERGRKTLWAEVLGSGGRIEANMRTGEVRWR